MTAILRDPSVPLVPPNGRLRRNPVVAARSGEGPFSEPTAAVRPWWRVPLMLRASMIFTKATSASASRRGRCLAQG